MGYHENIHVTGPSIIEICLLFQNFQTHNYLCHYAMATQLPALANHLIGFIIKVTECRYSILILHYDLL